MAYSDTPLTLAELRAALAGDLRDPGYKTFSITDMNRFLNDGLTEVNRVYPLELTEAFTCVEDQTSYPSRFTSAYRVEVWAEEGIVAILPFNDGDNSYAGWELQGTTLCVPPSVVSAEVMDQYTGLELRVTGYGRRTKMDTDGTATELDTEAELAVRWFAAYRGYSALMGDRSLYGQWAAQSNNTDVSMPMLMNLVNTASTEWNRHKTQLKSLRRSPVGGVVVM